VQAAAEEYRLGFVPVCSERYYLACRAEEVESPAIRALLETLKGRAFRQRVARLPGYTARDAGVIVEALETDAVPR
jgi:molybdate-binding protein